MKLIEKIRKRLIHARLRPIRVFCVHQVSNNFDPLRTYKGDWISTEKFKSSVLELKKEYTFISLPEAQRKLEKNLFRMRKYAVLTADDGYLCIFDVLPWLDQNGVPITLFLNARYLDGKSCSPHIARLARKEDDGMVDEVVAHDLYLTEAMLREIQSSSVKLASHGYDHVDATKLGKEEFVSQVQKNVEVLRKFESYIPFHAYTWGRHTNANDAVLYSLGMSPVLMDGQMNYKGSKVIHRELLPLSD